MSLDLIETKRLVLSGWRTDQLDELLALHGNAETNRYLTTDGAPWTRAEAEAALGQWMALFETRQLGKLRLTRKSDGQFVGRAGFGIYPRTGEPELGFALLKEYRGAGYATEATAGLRDWFFRAGKGEHFIGIADLRNSRSLAVLNRIGMEKTHIGIEPDGVACQFHIQRQPGHG